MDLPLEISFIVSQNDKGGNPKRPDYRGEVKIGPATYEVAAWKRTKRGTTRQFISGTLKLKVPKQADPQQSDDSGGFPASNGDESAGFPTHSAGDDGSSRHF